MQTMGPPPAKSPEKPLLITPSASPPPTRLSSRISDGASPTKKPRFNSIARLTPSDASSYASRTINPEDVQKERAASKMRLFDVWSSLAERYTVPVEEDDIINIQTGEITRDNGYLRRSKKLEFGSIALGDVPAEDYDSPEEEEDEYDIDELDAFADDASEISYQDMEGHPDDEHIERDVPPSTILTAADAEDLREFMNAERLRRELCGSDLEDEEVEGYTSPEEERTDSVEQAEHSTFPKSIISEEPELSIGDEEDVASQEERKTTDGNTLENLNRPSTETVSEDELDNWNIDDANVVYPIAKEEQFNDHGRSNTDSEIEIIEHFNPSSSIQKSTSRSQQRIFTDETPAILRSRRQVHEPLHQLYTPPESSSSSRPSATPSRNVIDLSHSSSSSSSPSKTRSDTPRNVNDLNYISNTAPDTPVPHINLAYLKKGKKSRSPSKLSSGMSSKSPTNTSTKLPTAQPFVLITPRQYSTQLKSETRHPTAPVRRFGETGTSIQKDEDPKLSRTSKGKNKAVDLSEDSQQQQSRTQCLPSSIKQGKVQQQSLQDSIPSSDESEAPIESSPITPLRFGVPKRKQNTVRVSPKSKNIKATMVKDHNGRKETYRQFQSDNSQSSPFKKRKRASSDVNSDFSDYAVQERESESSPLKSIRAPSRPSSSSSFHAPANNEHHRQKPRSRTRAGGRRANEYSASEDNYDSESSESESGDRHQRRKSDSGGVPMPVPHHGYHHIPYASSHYAPQPLPDPRAQLIISQAMQQLSALVGATWTPLQQYMEGSVPNTPHRRHDVRLPNGPFITPTHHPHPYSYMYDPALSNATLPPESSECDSSPTKLSSGRRKSLVKRSRSRGRRVSFNLDADARQRMVDEVDGYSSPPVSMSSKNLSTDVRQASSSRGDKSVNTKQVGQKHKREKTPGRRQELTDNDESDVELKRRGRTPGPSIESCSARKGSKKRP
ncbi:hypothetical protein JR316_0007131 [Psilocybe cubensis]|uniref:Uncharacterized protein n=2 Tax=Psilocybe cubensis TaxID=181762 RepID=A0A8H7XR97_PSICU|nr:hypothetical protein JR316_0007131 [Psilocybe cubensis]KAH9480531.1 hypothetical protein JR316_0007131 [Psilocybe cubensis]